MLRRDAAPRDVGHGNEALGHGNAVRIEAGRGRAEINALALASACLGLHVAAVLRLSLKSTSGPNSPGMQRSKGPRFAIASKRRWPPSPTIIS